MTGQIGLDTVKNQPVKACLILSKRGFVSLKNIIPPALLLSSSWLSKSKTFSRRSDVQNSPNSVLKCTMFQRRWKHGAMLQKSPTKTSEIGRRKFCGTGIEVLVGHVAAPADAGRGHAVAPQERLDD